MLENKFLSELKFEQSQPRTPLVHTSTVRDKEYLFLNDCPAEKIPDSLIHWNPHSKHEPSYHKFTIVTVASKRAQRDLLALDAPIKY